jgi:hypothetical protein
MAPTAESQRAVRYRGQVVSTGHASVDWCALLLVYEAQEITSKLLGIKTCAEILHTKNAAPINDQREKRMFQVAVLRDRADRAFRSRPKRTPNPRTGSREHLCG